MDLLEKLFDIARRVPFLAMTIVEKNGNDGSWHFRTQPLQTDQTESTREVPLELVPPVPAVATTGHNQPIPQHGQQQQLQRQHHQHPQQQKQHQQPSVVQAPAVFSQQNLS